MSFGVSGLIPKRLADVKLELEGTFQTILGIWNVDLASDGPFGQVIGVVADRETALWEIIEVVLASMFETGASGALLDQLYLLLNLVRLPSAPTRTVAPDGVTGTQQLTGTPGTIVPAGFVLETSDTEVSFTNDAAVTIGVGGTVLAIFSCVDVGPTPCLTGTLTVIPTPLTGLDSATNLQDGLLGNLQETDAAFRARRAHVSTTLASASAPAVFSAMLAIPDVLEVRLIQNRSDAPDDDGRPGHSYELLIRGGADAAIHAKIFETQPSGIETVGNVPGIVVDLHDDGQPVAFSRPTDALLWITVNMTVDDAFPLDGIAQVRNAILAYGQTALRIGATVSPFKIEQTIETPGIIIFDMRIGRSASPTNEDPIELTTVEMAVFDSSRLVVQRVN